jgi:hypothetical protein
VLIFLVGLTRVSNDDAEVASSLVNVGQQVGGPIGRAVVGTVARSAEPMPESPMTPAHPAGRESRGPDSGFARHRPTPFVNAAGRPA